MNGPYEREGFGSCGQGRGSKNSIFCVDVINGWPPMKALPACLQLGPHLCEDVSWRRFQAGVPESHSEASSEDNPVLHIYSEVGQSYPITFHYLPKWLSVSKAFLKWTKLIILGVLRGLSGVVGLTLPMARTDRCARPVYYLPCSDLGQVVNVCSLDKLRLL